MAITPYMAPLDTFYLIVNNVSFMKCTGCGEEDLNRLTIQKTEAIIEKI